MDIKPQLDQPPAKKIKSGQEIGQLIDECFKMQFTNNKQDRDQERLDNMVTTIREILEQAKSSSDVSLGPTKLEAKRSWGKCLGIMLENAPDSLGALKVLTERLTTGGGLF